MSHYCAVLYMSLCACCFNRLYAHGHAAGSGSSTLHVIPPSVQNRASGFLPCPNVSSLETQAPCLRGAACSGYRTPVTAYSLSAAAREAESISNISSDLRAALAPIDRCRRLYQTCLTSTHTFLQEAGRQNREGRAYLVRGPNEELSKTQTRTRTRTQEPGCDIHPEACGLKLAQLLPGF